MREDGNDDRLHPVRDEGDKHRRGIKEQIAEERPDAPDEEGGKGIEQDRRRADHDVVEIEVSAWDGDAEGAERDVQRREHCRHGQTQDGEVRFLIRFHGGSFPRGIPLFGSIFRRASIFLAFCGYLQYTIFVVSCK